ncbi:signal peptidase I [Streptomyces chromofuscus]|uniref:signal peptidase I n=1 Tax=Streptomyces chromofuscus TaxID=42881 RepID=UPI001D1464B3|nr:signal peptidase I [Streptomyces chromofuscus]
MDEIRRVMVAGWLVGVLGAVLVITSLLSLRAGYKLVTVQGESMTPTYGVGDPVVVERVGAEEVRRGDVVLYRVPERYQDAHVLQRVVGLGGDRVVCCAGAAGTDKERIVRNGAPLVEPYVRGGIADGTHRPYDVRVPEGRLFVLGDYRLNARDSRAFVSDHGGTVPGSAVVGRVTGDYVVPVLLALLLLVGVLLLFGAALLVAGARDVRRRPSTMRLWPEHF